MGDDQFNHPDILDLYQTCSSNTRSKREPGDPLEKLP